MYFWPERKNQRLREYDYSTEWCYFLTFCTKGRIHYFWEIQNSEMLLNDYGKEFDQIIQDTIDIRKEITLGEYIIMPNHVHILIYIQNPVGNAGMRSDRKEDDITKNHVSNYIQWIKSRFTREIRQNYKDYEFAWQKSFYDMIIRNEEQLEKTREYIILNPTKWEEDVNNLINIKPWKK